MSNEQLILTIGRIERALSRIERLDQTKSSPNVDSELFGKHEKLKMEMRDAIEAIDSLVGDAPAGQKES